VHRYLPTPLTFALITGKLGDLPARGEGRCGPKSHQSRLSDVTDHSFRRGPRTGRTKRPLSTQTGWSGARRPSPVPSTTGGRVPACGKSVLTACPRALSAATVWWSVKPTPMVLAEGQQTHDGPACRCGPIRSEHSLGMIGAPASGEPLNAGAESACADCLLGVLAPLSRSCDVRQEGRLCGVRDRG